MNIIQTVTKNTLALTLMNIIILILGFFFNVALARNFGVLEFGKFSFALAFTSLFAILLDLGFNNLIIRDVSKNKELVGTYVGNFLSIKLITSIIIFLIIVLIINMMQYPSDTKLLVYIFSIYVILGSFSGLFKATFHAFEKMEYNLFLSVVEKISLVSIGLTFLYLGYQLVTVASVYVIIGIANVILCLIVINKRIIKFKFNVDFTFWKKSIQVAIPLSLFGIFMVLNTRIDSVMLSIIKGDEAVGLYAAAYSLIFALYFIPTSIVGALFPLFSRMSTHSGGFPISICEKSIKYILILAFPISVSTIIFADRIIMLIYGEMYINSIIALKILILSIVPIFMYNILGAVILAINKERNAITIWGLAASVNVTLNLVLIPAFSYIGAALATLISEIMVCVLFYHVVMKSFPHISVRKILYKILIINVAIGALIFHFSHYNTIIFVLISIFIYIIALFTMKVFSIEDIKLFKQIISNTKGNETNENN